MEEKIEPVFDREYALEVTDGDTEFLKELAEVFSDDYPRKMAGISRSIREHDFNTLDEVAHSLKGASGNLGLTRVYELSYALEKMGKAKTIEGADETYQQLEEELERFSALIAQPDWETR